MRKIRVQIVDDSVVLRRLLTEILSQDSEIEAAGTASSGCKALAELPHMNSDFITLDIEIPQLASQSILTELRKKSPQISLVFSKLTEQSSFAKLEPLSSCHCKKPVAVHRSFPTPRTATPRLSNCTPQRAEVLLIGASTGGPKALSSVLKKLPANFPVPIVVVQHMPRLFTRHFANRLNEEISLKVLEAGSGMTLLPGHVFIAPGDFHLELYRHGNAIKTALQKCPPENSCRPAVDVLFRSAAKHYGPGCLALVLTGMGQDGLRGAQHIVDAGGKVLAQDEATSVVWGMPRAVAEAGFAESVLPLPLIPSEILRRVVFARQNVLAVERIS